MSTARAGYTVYYDSNSNVTLNNWNPKYSIPNADTTLTASSGYVQSLTSGADHTYTLPNPSTLVSGRQFFFMTANTSNVLTIQSNISSPTTLLTLSLGQNAIFTCYNTAGGDTTSWAFSVHGGNGGGGRQGALSTAYGGTGQTSLSATPAASKIALWDSNVNMNANAFVSNVRVYDTVANTGNTLTLTVSSPQVTVFTVGSATYHDTSLVLPVTSTLSLGQTYQLINDQGATYTMTVYSSGSGVIATVQSGNMIEVTCILLTGATAASWQITKNTAPAGGGTVSSVGLSAPAFLSVSGTPVTGSGTLSLSYSGTALPIANGGTAVTSVTTAPTASSFAGWDVSSNLSAKGFIPGFTSYASAGGATTLTVSSPQKFYSTGSTAFNVTLPTTGVVAGQSWIIMNGNSASNITVKASGGATIDVVVPGTRLELTALVNTPTLATDWTAI